MGRERQQNGRLANGATKTVVPYGLNPMPSTWQSSKRMSTAEKPRQLIV